MGWALTGGEASTVGLGCSGHVVVITGVCVVLRLLLNSIDFKLAFYIQAIGNTHLHQDHTIQTPQEDCH